MLDKILQFTQRGVMMHPTLQEHVTVRDYKWHKISNEAEFTFSIDDDKHTEFVPGWDLDNYIAAFKDIPKAGQKPNNPMQAEVDLMKKKVTSSTAVVIKEKEEIAVQNKSENNTPQIITPLNTDIKKILFETIDKLQKKQMDVKTAQTIGNICQVAINAIKLEKK